MDERVCGRKVKWVKEVKRDIFPVLRYISHGDIIYVTIVNNPVLQIRKLLRE